MTPDPEFSLYIHGQWCAGATTVINRNPSNLDDIIGHYAQADNAQAAQAVDAARAAQPGWAQTPLEDKQRLLHAIGDALIQRCDELGALLSREEGKTRPEGRGEVYRAGQFFHYYAAEVLRQIGDLADSVRPGISIEVTREAVGVVAILSPWNFPIATAAWKIAPALAFGNAVVWKPANLMPASAVALTQVIHQAGLPAGVFNLVLGSGSGVGNALIHSDRIDAVSFTGSVPVGRQVAAATAPNFVRCQLEMGSKNALVIMDDADLDTVVQADDGVFMGPVVDDTQLTANLRWVDRARALGGELAFGGTRLDCATPGYFMAPTVFINTDNAWDVNQEELFAPLACVIRVRDLDEAIATVNDTRFGLTAGIVT